MQGGRSAETTEGPQRESTSSGNHISASSGAPLQTQGASGALKVSSPAPIEDGDWGDISASQVDLDRLLRSNSSSKSAEPVNGRSKQGSAGSRKQNGAAPAAASQKAVPPRQGEAQQGVSWRGGFAAAQQPPSSWSVPTQQVRKVADIGSQRPANLPQGSARNSAFRCVLQDMRDISTEYLPHTQSSFNQVNLHGPKCRWSIHSQNLCGGAVDCHWV